MSSTRRRPGYRLVFGSAGVLCVLLMAGVAAAGDSAAVPGLGAATWHPSWDLDLGLSSGLVSVMLVVAAALGATAVVAGLLAVRSSSFSLSPRNVSIAAVSAVVLLTALPPLGSADHLSYLAYGRIAAAGDDPYVVDPSTWRDGTDPVASAVQPPWQHTTSVYGPVSTAVQALAAWAGGGSLRLSVWFWQILCGLAFLLVAFTLDRITRDDPRARARTWVLWTLNPLLLGQVVLGGHLDVISVAFAIGAIALAARRPVAAGVLIGAAVGSKITFGLFALAILWGLRRRPLPQLARHIGVMTLAGLAVLVPAHLWSGPHTYDLLHKASRQVSLAAPWRLLTDQLDPVFGGSVRDVVAPVAMGLGALLVLLLLRRLRDHPTGVGTGEETASMARAAFALATGWLLMTPYSLPWYDSMVWAPLALLAPTLLDGALLARLLVLVLAYVPGRVVGMSVQVEDISLGFRKSVAPWLELAVVITVVVWTCLHWNDFRWWSRSRGSIMTDDEELASPSPSVGQRFDVGSTD
ncbi:polyprenol phosphomannose-dependent alpha 1,6 mannosyltransferase MptB [Kineosporia sp. J2-2]|uniref:Polyprenol phosphomannose-dependent alpha 1,6 mannosyltransferase MptB n=1 Tax=Kineosporia corallincola TaxID=2835133 RepID=A0ABS5TLA5_9ACTN|nr:polyprenol phosphomannose-dependent alpha 1,6 mannosyltransferase MptB [Kineosporia corallincola]MBT0771149.1 polyprenol phosphomannose-dependent alpha 1,6 mannosyltransferase MptB [Kineosporia corallincola]